jgi:hypothetical protein
MNISIDINIRASEDITNSLLTLAAVLHNAVPIFDKSPKVIESKEEPIIKNKEVKALNEVGALREVGAPKEKVETSNHDIKEITLEEVRGFLGSLSDKGKGEEVKALIKKFGASRLTEIPKEKYVELLSEADSLN